MTRDNQMSRDKWRHHKKIKKKIKDDLKQIKRTYDSFQLEIGQCNWILIDRRYDKIY